MTPVSLWDGLALSRNERLLHIRADRPLIVLSSAIVGADLPRTRHILNMRVDKNYASLTPWEDLRSLSKELGIEESFVGLLTAARLETAQAVIERDSQTSVAAIVSVGVSRPVAAGVTDAAPAEVGTINAIVVVDGRLSPAARVNAVITVTEAKMLALVEADVRAPHGGPASGTATDAVVVASTECGPAFEFAGPVSPLGALLARAVRRAVQQSLAER